MKSNALWTIDVLGGLVTATLVCSACWFAFFRPETASGRVAELTTLLEQRRDKLRQLQFSLEAQSTTQRELTALLRDRGRLPEKSPIEKDLQTITSLAESNRIRFEQVIPTATMEYPNVLQQSYRIRAVGTFADHLRLFRDFEECSFWADVTHLKLEQTTEEMTNLDPTRHSEITLSFFSALQ
jgi:Tfp pilus assembly protein PilO